MVCAGSRIYSFSWSENDMEVNAATAPPDPERRSFASVLDVQLKELEVRQLEIRLAVELANFGLRGTLMGALLGMLALVIFALIGAFSERIGINGVHLCIMTGLICLTVVSYGAFVFNRSLKVAALWKDRVPPQLEMERTFCR